MILRNKFPSEDELVWEELHKTEIHVLKLVMQMLIKNPVNRISFKTLKIHFENFFDKCGEEDSYFLEEY